MMRNKEFRYYLYASIAITLVAVLIMFKFNPFASLVILIVSSLLIAINFLYTKKRYDDIYGLSHYLRTMIDGNYGIEVRNNEEGELSILRNELFKITARLNEQHDYLAEDRERMAEALADISHQLKTPLTSIQMMVDLLENDTLPIERRAEFMGNIQTQLERMDWLVKVLLKLSKLDAGTVQFYKTDTSLEGIVKTATRAVQVAITAKQIKLSIPDTSTPTIRVDEKWMPESILNVLKNAVEHTPEYGEIKITWDDNPILTSLTIFNSGKAIDKDDLPYLFKRFYKGKHASESSVGIGLSLSLQIMEAHNGTIEVVSEVDKGTSFTFKWYKHK